MMFFEFSKIPSLGNHVLSSKLCEISWFFDEYIKLVDDKIFRPSGCRVVFTNIYYLVGNTYTISFLGGASFILSWELNLGNFNVSNTAEHVWTSYSSNLVNTLFERIVFSNISFDSLNVTYFNMVINKYGETTPQNKITNHNWKQKRDFRLLNSQIIKSDLWKPIKKLSP